MQFLQNQRVVFHLIAQTDSAVGSVTRFGKDLTGAPGFLQLTQPGFYPDIFIFQVVNDLFEFAVSDYLEAKPYKKQDNPQP